MIELVFPKLQHKAAALEYKQEHIDNEEMDIHGDGGLDEAETYEKWLNQIKVDLTRDDGVYVPATVYFAMVGDEIVGIIHIRHKLNDFLRNFGGHIGYGVAPEKRRRGYATKMLNMALKKCKELEITKVLVTCEKSNIASAKTIIENGGILENEVDFNGKIMERYWIDNN